VYTIYLSLLAAGTLCNRRGRLARRIAYVLSEALRAGAILVYVEIRSHLFLACFFLGILRLPALIFSSDCDRHSINQIIIQLAHEKCSNVCVGQEKKHNLIFEPVQKEMIEHKKYFLSSDTLTGASAWEKTLFSMNRFYQTIYVRDERKVMKDE
jgi:hypothetical protein